MGARVRTLREAGQTLYSPFGSSPDLRRRSYSSPLNTFIWFSLSQALWSFVTRSQTAKAHLAIFSMKRVREFLITWHATTLPRIPCSLVLSITLTYCSRSSSMSKKAMFMMW